MRKKLFILFAMTALLPLIFAQPTFASTTINLPAGGGLLGISCGGIHTSTYVTGFDSAGNITGKAYAWTRCGSSGRGGGYTSKLYSSWHNMIWNLNGAIVATLPNDGIAPNLAFTATDSSGDMIYTKPISTSYGPAYVGVLVKP